MGPDVDCLVVEAEEAPEAGHEPQTVLTVPRPDVGVRPPANCVRLEVFLLSLIDMQSCTQYVFMGTP